MSICAVNLFPLLKTVKKGNANDLFSPKIVAYRVYVPASIIFPTPKATLTFAAEFNVVKYNNFPISISTTSVSILRTTQVLLYFFPDL